MDNVTVPVELPDGLKDIIVKPGQWPFMEAALWEAIKETHAKISAHFQENPIVSAAAKAANYWEAMSKQQQPDWVPSRICLCGDVEGPIRGTWFDTGSHKCRADRMGHAYLTAKKGGLWLVTSNQFVVREWKKSEA